MQTLTCLILLFFDAVWSFCVSLIVTRHQTCQTRFTRRDRAVSVDYSVAALVSVVYKEGLASVKAVAGNCLFAWYFFWWLSGYAGYTVLLHNYFSVLSTNR